MNKSVKKGFITLIVCVLSAVMCFGMLAACGDKGGNTTPEQPVHHEAVAAKCATLGNIEYWSKGGKYYRDAACTQEISRNATFIAILGHDFADAPYVTTDAEQHWKVCKRDGCDETAQKANHKYEGGKCVCGKDEPKAPETPKHFAAKSAKCTEAGNIEYWTKGGKFYSDEACTTEITEEDTVIAALDHDFEEAPYEKNDAQHWQVCKREGCDVTTTKVGHTYVSGKCVCGKDEPSTPVTSYTVTVDDTVEHGTVTVSKTTAIKDEEITVTVTPDDGYLLNTLVYNDGDNDHDIMADKTFTMPEANVTVTATFKSVASAFELWEFTGENDETVDLGVTRTNNGKFAKVSATNPDGTDWHIKLARNMDAVTIGHFYEVTYSINYKVMSAGEEVEDPASGEVWFETSGVENYDYYAKRNFDLVKGDNTVKFTFRADKTLDESNAVLLLGKLPAGFEVEIEFVSCVEKQNVGNYIEGWTEKSECEATIDKTPATDGSFTVTIDGSVAAADAWKLKLEKSINLENGHEYELTLIYVITGGGQGNAKYEVYKGDNDMVLATVADELLWYNSQYDAGKLITKTVKITATADGTIGACIQLGEWTSADSPVTITVLYAELKDVTPAE